jgi:hypothetical protein
MRISRWSTCIVVVAVGAVVGYLQQRGQSYPTSVLMQSISYLARPHVPFTAFEDIDFDALGNSTAAWTSASLHADRAAWEFNVTAAMADAATASVAAFLRRGTTLHRMRRGDVDLSAWSACLAGCRRELAEGHGLCLVRGVPTAAWSVEASGAFFWAVGLELGVPGSQNKAGDLLGVIRDLKQDAATARLGYTNAAIRYHVDFADSVGLLCLQRALHGGVSRIVSSVSVLVELGRRDPAAVRALLAGPHRLDTRGSAYPRAVPTRMLAVALGGRRVSTSFNGDYFRSAWAAAGGLPPALAAAYDAYERVAGDPALYLEMDLQPGDLQLLSNHRLLHARSAFVDGAAADTTRHLLRLWLTTGVGAAADAEAPRWSWGTGALRELERARLLFALAGAHVGEFAERIRGNPPASTAACGG